MNECELACGRAEPNSFECVPASNECVPAVGGSEPGSCRCERASDSWAPVGTGCVPAASQCEPDAPRSIAAFDACVPDSTEANPASNRCEPAASRRGVAFGRAIASVGPCIPTSCSSIGDARFAHNANKCRLGHFRFVPSIHDTRFPYMYNKSQRPFVNRQLLPVNRPKENPYKNI